MMTKALGGCCRGEVWQPEQYTSNNESGTDLVVRAQGAYAMVFKRQQILGARLFFDPAWNMLLDLFINESAGRRLSVTALCIGSYSSTATALRYVTLLMNAGLIKRVADDTDGRRCYVHLTAKGWQSMQEVLS